MNTPVCDFLKKYAQLDNLRLHMPGHKGKGELEQFDLTEIDGADSLYEANGIIKESEDNASRLFGSKTFYSAGGSSLSIRAMLYLALLMKKRDERPLILAGRNAHKVFISAAALLDFDIEWIAGDSSYLCCQVTAEEIKERILSAKRKPLAVYITSPDYLGNMSDIESIAKVCHSYGILLLVDNAHGAYLAFTAPSLHPIALGADMCADSAHKTLPSLTGAAYLHIANTVPENVRTRAKAALSLFGSTSPSYLILASLDMLNRYLADGYREKLEYFSKRLEELKRNLAKVGYETVGDEPMKITIMPKSYGYTGYELGEYLKKNKIVHEFADPDYLVLMPTPEIGESELTKLEVTLLNLKRRTPINSLPPRIAPSLAVMSPREAVLSPAEKIPTSHAIGRILADVTVGCPPAVPIAVSGERITKEAVQAFEYYGIDTCFAVIDRKEKLQ